METVPVTIIGGGIVGLGLAYELSNYLGPGSVYLFEKNSVLGAEQSGRSSEVVHSGINQHGLKLELCVEGNILMREFAHKYNIPLLDTGILITSHNSKQKETLQNLLEEYKFIPGLKQINSSEINRLEPNILSEYALYNPTTATIDTATLTDRLAHLTRKNGVEILLGSEITNIEASEKEIILNVSSGKQQYSFKTDYLINSAGLHCDKVAKMINPQTTYEVVPVKGEYYQFQNKGKWKVNRNIYPPPWKFEHQDRTYYDLGVHLTPDATGKMVRVGPYVTPISEKNDYTLNTPQEVFIEKLRPFYCRNGEEQEFTTEAKAKLKPGHVGIIAEIRHTHDFDILRDPKYNNCINLLGMESPALTSVFAIAKYVKNKYF